MLNLIASIAQHSTVYCIHRNNGLENTTCRYQPIPRFVCNIEAQIPRAKKPLELVNNYYIHNSHYSYIITCTHTSMLFTCSVDKTGAIWDVEAGERIKKLKGHTSFVNSCCPTRRGVALLATGSDDGNIKVSWLSRKEDLRNLNFFLYA